MKKGTKIALLIGILLLAFGLTVMQIARHRGEGFSFSVPAVSSVGTLNYDQKGYTVCADGEESFSTNEVKELKLDWLSGSVTVERYDGKAVVVREKAAVRLEEDECLRWRLSGGTTVLVPQGLTLKGVDADSTSASVRVSGLSVRDAIRADSISGSLYAEDCVCGSLSLNSTSGSQHILRADVSGNVDADSISGSFTAEDLRCGELDVDSTSGSHKISALSCGKLRLSSISGSQRVSGLDCREADASSTSGSVHLAFAAAPASVDVETTSGSVELTFPKGTGIDLDYDRSTGSLHGDVIHGALPVEVETTSGSLTIRYQD